MSHYNKKFNNYNKNTNEIDDYKIKYLKNLNQMTEIMESIHKTEKLCFLCERRIHISNSSYEHIIPKWTLKLYSVNTRKNGLGIKMPMGKYIKINSKIPCCKECNSLLNVKIENNMQKIIQQNIKNDNYKIYISIWGMKIILAMLMFSYKYSGITSISKKRYIRQIDNATLVRLNFVRNKILKYIYSEEAEIPEAEISILKHKKASLNYQIDSGLISIELGSISAKIRLEFSEEEEKIINHVELDKSTFIAREIKVSKENNVNITLLAFSILSSNNNFTSHDTSIVLCLKEFQYGNIRTFLYVSKGIDEKSTYEIEELPIPIKIEGATHHDLMIIQIQSIAQLLESKVLIESEIYKKLTLNLIDASYIY